MFTLPEINFIAGEQQTIEFVLKTQDGKPFNTDGIKTNFALVYATNRTGLPVLSKSCFIENNSVTVELLPIETLTLSGKYIYQITIIDSKGNTDIPGRGNMFITKNINPDYIYLQS